MKRLNLIWLFLFALFISCGDNDKIEDIQSEYILAGVDSDKFEIQKYSSGLKISFENEASGDYPTTGYSGDLLIDLDSDNSNDIMFHAYYGYGCSMAGCFSPTKACEISVIDNKQIEIYAEPLTINDTIDSKLDWKLLGPNTDGEIYIKSTVLSSFTPEWTNTAEIANNKWTTEDLYLAIRVKQGDIYKFGWIRLLIDDYYDIDIREIGLEK
jgi:hypothetical protein